MTNEIPIVNILIYGKTEKNKQKTFNLFNDLHGGKKNNVRCKYQKMKSKNTGEFVNASYAKFNLLCN